jgi:hypothetical protein
MSHYDVLGVKPTASQKEINEAYRFLARQLHPDRHPGASKADIARFEASMARVNEAYSVLRDPDARRAHDRGDTASNPPVGESPLRPPLPDECTVCGFQPAAPVRFRHQHAYVVRATLYTTEGVFCRDCGRCMGRSKQNRTLWTGWWGALSLFRNIAIIGRNALELRKLNRLQRPRARLDIDQVVVPLVQPLAPGTSVWRRGGVRFALVAWSLVAVMGIAVQNGNDDPSVDAALPADEVPVDGRGLSVVDWRVGGCVIKTGSSYLPVDCSDDHDGVVADFVYASVNCQTPEYVAAPDHAGYSGYYCIAS